MIALYLVGGVVALPVLVVVGLPGWDSVAHLGGSSLIHTTYTVTLAAAYHHGDFSLAYPVARGGGAFLAALGGVVLLGDHLPPLAWAALVVVAAGLVTLGGTHTSAIAMRWALITAVVIGGYTVVDVAGARSATTGAAYGFTLLAVTTVPVAALATTRGAWGRLAAARDRWPRWLAGGVLMDAAYVLVLIASRHAPVGLVAMLRESSVILAAAAGWLFLREDMGRRRLVAATVMTLGLAGLVWADLG